MSWLTNLQMLGNQMTTINNNKSLCPFTAYIQLPDFDGLESDVITDNIIISRKKTRNDYLSNLSRLAILIYEALELESDITLPNPGSGQRDLRGLAGSLQSGTGSKPAFGNEPDLLMIEGFHNYNVDNQVSNKQTRIMANGVYSGYGGEYPWAGSDGFNTLSSAVAELKLVLDSVISSVDNNALLYRLIYNNIIWGNRGHHFPN